VVAISTALSATHGLLIRNRNAFESARTLDTVIFDKTGTLTRGIYEVNRIIPLNTQYTENELLQYAASVQQQAGHPVSSGLIRKVRERGLPTWPLEQFSYVQGIGVEGLVNRRSVISAGPNYFRQHGLPVPALPPGIDQNAETVSYLLIDRQPAAIFTLADSIRPSSAAAIQALQQMHIQVYLLTGDNESLARSIADKLGMNGYFANVLPHEKQEKVRAFQAEGKQVAMTGDGINDAPALAQADVGIAIGSGTDVAAETADLILVNSDPADVADMIAFSRATYRKMIQNLAWALGYNLVAIPLAAGILYPRFMLSPAMGAVLMTLSTIIVAFNAELLKSGFRQIRG
jgi:Cu2+-exporting ATPase